MNQVLIPRAVSQAAELAAAVAEAGFQPVVVPFLAIETVPHQPPNLADFDWLVFTSQNAVRAAAGWLTQGDFALAAVGTQTAIALTELGLSPIFVPKQQNAAGLVAQWPQPGTSVLHLAGQLADAELAQGLARQNCVVTTLTVYETQLVDPAQPELRRQYLAGNFTAALFTSPSTVQAVLRFWGRPPTPTLLGAIGPKTSAALTTAGLASFVAASPTSQALVAALLAKLAKLDS